MTKDKIINFRYVFYPFLAFFLGIAVARKLYAGALETILICVAVFSLLSTFLLIKKIYKPLIILFACFFLGNGFYFLGEMAYKEKEYSSEVSVVGRATDNIIINGYYAEIILEDVKINGESGGNIRLKLSSVSKAPIAGEMIAFESKLENAKLFTLGSFNSSDYRKNIKYYAEVPYSNVVITEGYLKIDEKIRLSVKNELYEHMSEKNVGISYAVLFGDKNDLDETTEKVYQNSGIIHILTVSGLHVGFLITLVFGFLKLCKTNKYIRFIITTIFIILYAYLCGFAPSVMRAGIMAVVLMLSKLFERRYDSLNSLGLSGFLICMFSPLSALDVGFQMSFFCVAGIIMLAKPLARFFSKFLPYKIAELVSLSMAAQIGIMPIVASFGVEVNMLSVFANLIVVPVFSLLYPFLFVVSLLSTFIPFVGHLLKLVDYVFVAINALANFFGNANISFKSSPLKTSVITIYFFGLFALGRYSMTKPLYKFVAFSVMIFMMVATSLFYKIPQKPENSISYISAYGNSSVVLINDKGQRIVVGDSYVLSRYLSMKDISYIDGFISINKMSYDSVERLSELGMQTFIGNVENQNNQNFTILENNLSYNFGDYTINYVYASGDTLGVCITFGEENIFVASKNDIDYNSSVIQKLDASLVFADGGYFNENAIFVTSSQIEGNDYNYQQHGNMKFKFNGKTWIERGID